MKRILYILLNIHILSYIVSIMNTFKTIEYLFFLMEFEDGITLREYLNDKNRKTRDLNEAQYYGGLLSSVLSY